MATLPTAQNTPGNREHIAAAFLKELTSWFAEAGIKATAEHIKNGNDYYDANMAMDAAFNNCGFDTFDSNGQMTQETCELFDSAWDRAVEMAQEKEAKKH